MTFLLWPRAFGSGTCEIVGPKPPSNHEKEPHKGEEESCTLGQIASRPRVVSEKLFIERQKMTCSIPAGSMSHGSSRRVWNAHKTNLGKDILCEETLNQVTPIFPHMK